MTDHLQPLPGPPMAKREAVVWLSFTLNMCHSSADPRPPAFRPLPKLLIEHPAPVIEFLRRILVRHLGTAPYRFGHAGRISQHANNRLGQRLRIARRYEMIRFQ